MSIVGPRPVTAIELERYGSVKESYLACKPGVTGVWQVSGRNDTSYFERIAFDKAYYSNISLILDLKVILLTPIVVLKLSGR
jgi:lipopolysaccharide/colanic/teichoic acid biosynthesis glycosyltransferase